MADGEIDLSDKPELSEHQLKTARRVRRHPTGDAKQLLALWVAPSLLAKLR